MPAIFIGKRENKTPSAVVQFTAEGVQNDLI